MSTFDKLSYNGAPSALKVGSDGRRQWEREQQAGVNRQRFLGREMRKARQSGNLERYLKLESLGMRDSGLADHGEVMENAAGWVEKRRELGNRFVNPSSSGVAQGASAGASGTQSQPGTANPPQAATAVQNSLSMNPAEREQVAREEAGAKGAWGKQGPLGIKTPADERAEFARNVPKVIGNAEGNEKEALTKKAYERGAALGLDQAQIYDAINGESDLSPGAVERRSTERKQKEYDKQYGESDKGFSELLDKYAVNKDGTPNKEMRRMFESLSPEDRKKAMGDLSNMRDARENGDFGKTQPILDLIPKAKAELQGIIDSVDRAKEQFGGSGALDGSVEELKRLRGAPAYSEAQSKIVEQGSSVFGLGGNELDPVISSGNPLIDGLANSQKTSTTQAKQGSKTTSASESKVDGGELDFYKPGINPATARQSLVDLRGYSPENADIILQSRGVTKEAQFKAKKENESKRKAEIASNASEAFRKDVIKNPPVIPSWMEGGSLAGAIYRNAIDPGGRRQRVWERHQKEVLERQKKNRSVSAAIAAANNP